MMHGRRSTSFALVAVCFLLTCDAKRVEGHGQRVGPAPRFALLKGAAAAIGEALSTMPTTTKTQAEEMLIKEVTSLEKRKSRFGAAWSDNAPEASAASASPSQMQVTILARRDSEATHMWVKKVPLASDSTSSKPEVVLVQKITPGRQAVLSAMLPDGEYIAMAFSRRHGLWRSSPFKVGYNSIEI